jgi:hypothetical protein
MDRAILLKKFEAMLDEFERGRVFGYVQVDFVSGRPDLIRKMITQKISSEGNSQHEQQPKQR